MARASGGANNMHPLSWGGINGKDPKLLTLGYCREKFQRLDKRFMKTNLPKMIGTEENLMYF